MQNRKSYHEFLERLRFREASKEGDGCDQTFVTQAARVVHNRVAIERRPESPGPEQSYLEHMAFQQALFPNMYGLVKPENGSPSRGNPSNHQLDTRLCNLLRDGKKAQTLSFDHLSVDTAEPQLPWQLLADDWV